MHTCIYKKVKFEESDGEHVLQNFLGARWVSSKISCNEVQAQFGASIDVALEKGLREVRNLLGTKGGRGGEGPTLKGIPDTEGTKFNLKPGGVPEISEPAIRSQSLPDGTQVIEGKIGNKNKLEWLIHELRAAHPNVNIDVDQLRALATSQRGYLDSHLHLQPCIGGADYFRGLLKSAFNLLGANASNIALLPCFDCLRNFIVDDVGSAETFIRWYSSSSSTSGVPALGKFDHFVCVYSDGSNVDGLVQFFGGIGHIVRLGRGYEGQAFKFGYLVNPLRDSDPAETREPTFNINLLPKFDGGHAKPGPEVWPVYKAIYANYMERSLDMEISRIIQEVMNSSAPDASPEQIVGEISQKMALFTLGRIDKE